MKVITETQGTAAWLAARCGKITASRIADVLAVLKRKDAESAQRSRYRMELIAERLTGRAAEHYVSEDMEFGTENEPLARAEYELLVEESVDLVGFVEHPSLPYSGASPDGLIGLHGGLELKCPKTTTHLKYRADGVVPEQYIPQMIWGMACCERQWWDFASYDPRLPKSLQLFVKRLEYDSVRDDEVFRAVVQFEGELQEAIQHLGLPPNYWARDTSTAPIEAKDFFLDDEDLDRIIKL